MLFKDFLGGTIGDSKQVSDKEIRYCCPFCGETDYKFYVKIADDSSDGQYQCKKCGASGNPITFMREFYNLGNNKEAYDVLVSNGIELDTSGLSRIRNTELTEKEKMLLLINGYEETKEQGIKKLTPPPLPTGLKFLSKERHKKEAQPFIQYLHNRGISDKQIDEHSIGYIISGWFESSGGKYVNLRNSIVFFTFDNSGNYIYWNTRSIEPNVKIKSINAPAKDNEYSRKEVLFNLNRAKNLPFIVLNEGVFDALTFQDYGIASFGKQVTETQVKLILKNITKETVIFLYLDSDAIEVTKTLASRLYKEHKRTYIVPHGENDANDLGIEKAFKTLKENALLATPENITSFELRERLHLNF